MTGPAFAVGKLPTFSAEMTLASITPGTLIEREEENAALRAALEDARGGTGCVALIEGPAGIGKTRLLVEAGATARSEDTLVLEARGKRAGVRFRLRRRTSAL